MLRQVADGVLVHESEFVQSNATVVQGRAGVLLIDAGILDRELACLAGDLSESGQAVVAAFATHPDWDHVLWHPDLGAAPATAPPPVRPPSATSCPHPAPKPRSPLTWNRRGSPIRSRSTCTASSRPCPWGRRRSHGTARR
ncbi:MBL fold metallo-hydrolase [Catellatospora bangladeshensis]|uniref:MBL fold metallo-hydrolase n=1 Tax=Catellatospora bangladeshensis TaxID=310355 RepID=UPI0036169276